MVSTVVFLLILENPTVFQRSTYTNALKESIQISSKPSEFTTIDESAHECNQYTTKLILNQLSVIANIDIATSKNTNLEKFPFLSKDFSTNLEEEDIHNLINTDTNPTAMNEYKIPEANSAYRGVINESVSPILVNEDAKYKVENQINKFVTKSELNEINEVQHTNNYIQTVDITTLSNINTEQEHRYSALEITDNNKNNSIINAIFHGKISNEEENPNIIHESHATEIKDEDVFKNVTKEKSATLFSNIEAIDVARNTTNKEINISLSNVIHDVPGKPIGMKISDVKAFNSTKINNREIDSESNFFASTIINSTANEINTKENPLMAPFLVAIFETFSNATAQTCAGTLVSRRWVLTAAHCIDVLSTMYGGGLKTLSTTNQSSQSTYKVTAGARNVYIAGTTYNVSKVLVHPGWPAQRAAGNVALLQLKEDIELTDAIQPLKLLREEPDGEVMMESYGWGVPSGDNLESRTTFAARKLSRGQCSRAISLGTTEDQADGVMASSQICLVPATLGDCKSNSGGPIVYAGGLLAVGEFEECDSEHMLLASSVPMHAQWIDEVIGN